MAPNRDPTNPPVHDINHITTSLGAEVRHRHRDDMSLKGLALHHDN
jgi:hypothetical protein